MEDNRKRNMERRRETSRYAARDRRGKEADIFGDLREVVPIVEEGTVTHLDRIALLRVAATVCRLRKTASNVLETTLEAEKIGDVWNEDVISECLDGFVMIADSDSTILYVTESVAIYLGLTQTDLTGRTLKEFLHPADYDELLKITNCPEEGANAVFRMKTVISPRGRCLNLKSALFKPVSFLIHSKQSAGGHVFIMQGVTIPAGQGSINANASSVTKFSDTPNGAFMTRHTCDMRISFVSDRFNYILRSELKSLMGTSFYDLVHPADMVIVSKSMKELFEKGHTRTPYYRLIAANNTLAWVQTEATTISHTTKGQKGQYVICVHFVLGIQGAEESLVVSTDAMPAGVQVDIKKEIDDTRDYIGRQPEIVECVDFTPLIGDEPFEMCPLEPVPAFSDKSDMGPRKSSFDDVLQWLFRDQPSSPAPIQRSSRRVPTTAPQTNDPALSSALFMDSSSRSNPRSRSQHHTLSSYDFTPASTSASSTTTPSPSNYPTRRAQSSSNSSNARHYSPLAEGLSQCGLGSPTSVQTGRCAYGDIGNVVGGTNVADNSTRRFSAISPSDHLDVPSAGLGCAKSPQTDLFTTMPATNTDNTQQSIRPAAQTAQINYQDAICDDIPFEAPDFSDNYAPYVDTGDMLQIGDGSLQTPFLQCDDYLAALYDLPDFQPTQPLMPAARPVTVERMSPPAKRQMPISDFNYPTQNLTFAQFDQYWQEQQQQQQNF
ncbi:unnamed protein product [Caenorhabditis angaria]|uniref:Uncharacterized protein n=1 Tax=Caenorhabditis angaria TaxID=860376 RepID=A0A9P1N953_9PELO|nr:unnamed protein product [Caenorhabditis angaria]